MVDDVLAEVRRIARELGGLLTDLSRRVERIESGSRATQLGNSSIEAGALVLGKRNAKHVQLGPFGIRQYTELGQITFAAGAGSIAGGNFLTIIDPSSGLALAAIDENGTVTATDFQAIGTAYFAGDALPDVIDGRLVGDLKAHVPLDAQSATTTGTLGLVELIFDADANSYYEIQNSPVLLGSSAGDDVERCSLNLHVTLDGSTPMVTTPMVVRDRGKDDRSFRISHLLYVETAATVRLLLSITDLGTGGVNAQPSPAEPLQLWAKRVGKQIVASNGAPSTGGGTTDTPAQQKTRTWRSTWSRKWDKDSMEGDTTTVMVQGNFGDIHGDWRSVFGWNEIDDIRAELAGATIDKVEMFLYAVDWKNADGGFVRMGWSGLDSPPGNNLYPNDVSATRFVWKLPKPGGYFNDLGSLGRTVIEDLRDGTVGSFALDATDVPDNPADAGSFVPGRVTDVANRPALRVTFTS